MKRLIRFLPVVLTMVLVSANVLAQEKKPGDSPEAKDKKEKAPENKIEQYFLVILKTGTKQTKEIDSATRSELFKGHMANIERLYYDGVLKVAGPFGKNDFKWRGLFIFDCKTKEEVEKIVATDPTVAAGIFDVDIVPWYSEPIGSFKHGKPDKP